MATTDLQLLHQKYFGAVDKAFSDINEYQKNFIYVETRRHIFKSKLEDNKLCKNSGDLSEQKSDHDKNYAVHNLRIVSGIENCMNLELEIGGSLMDKTYPYILLDYTPFDLLQTGAIPFGTQDIRLYTEHINEFIIEYDIVKLDKLVSGLNILHKQLQYCGEEIIDKNIFKIKKKIPFNNPVTLIKSYISTPSAKNLRLCFYENNKEVCCEIPFKKYTNFWQVDFGKNTVNFSCVDVYLEYETDGESHSENTFALSKNLLVFKNDMCGLAFSK